MVSDTVAKFQKNFGVSKSLFMITMTIIIAAIKISETCSSYVNLANKINANVYFESVVTSNWKPKFSRKLS